ncbi:MAG: EF-hand domain-containing protein [Sulfitobacter sp.]
MKNLIAITALTVCTAFAALAENTLGSHFILNWDLDENGAFSVEEITERREMVFNMFDDDQNGLLNAAEYVIFNETRAADMENKARRHGKGGHRMQEGQTLGFNGTDEVGEVSMEEFIARSAAWVAQVDRDGENAITAAGFGPQGN